MPINSICMLKQYFLFTFKNLKKQKVFSVINMLGLSVGIACCLVILLIVKNELSYDSFHRNEANIYRVLRTGETNGRPLKVPYLAMPYGPALQNDFAQAVESTVRVMPDDDLISYGTEVFHEKRIYLADSNFFQFFDFKLLRGNKENVLADPNSIVITETTAKKYFGRENPLGKVLVFNKKHPLKVTGIAADVPSDSHLQFDMVIPIDILRTDHADMFDNWPNNMLFTYVTLRNHVKPQTLEKQFPAFMNKYLGDYYEHTGFKMGLMLMPLKDVYFANNNFDNVKHGNKAMVYIFLSIALLVLIIACINFINMSTAKAQERAKEVGIKKVLGALRKELVTQFIFESLFFAAASCIIAILLIWMLVPYLESILGYSLPLSWSDGTLYLFIGAIILLVGILSGSYPAFLLASFSPAMALKGEKVQGGKSAFFRKALVVFQFCISVILIISVTGIMWQMQYVRNFQLGFDDDQSMIIRLDNRQIYDNASFFKNELHDIPTVKEVSLMSGEPGGFFDIYSFEVENHPGDKMQMNTEFTDLDFAKTLGLKFIAGRDFSRSFGTDSLEAAIVNRNAALEMGFTPQEAIGKWIQNLNRDSVRRRIVGVVENFHYSSLKNKIGSLVIAPGSDRRLALIKINSKNLPATVDKIRQVYSKSAPSTPFEFSFLNENFDKLYRNERKQETVLLVFAAIAIFIACLGLFGLTSYSVLKRTKEIGVRKVLGSTVSGIIFLVTKDLLKPVLLASVIALPLGYFFLNKWLQEFAYRIQLHAIIFMVAVLAAMIIAIVTVSFHAIRAARANPVKSLRTE